MRGFAEKTRNDYVWNVRPLAALRFFFTVTFELLKFCIDAGNLHRNRSLNRA